MADRDGLFGLCGVAIRWGHSVWSVRVARLGRGCSRSPRADLSVLPRSRPSGCYRARTPAVKHSARVVAARPCSMRADDGCRPGRRGDRDLGIVLMQGLTRKFSTWR